MRNVLVFTTAIGTVVTVLAAFAACAFFGLMAFPQAFPHALAMDLLLRLDPTGHGPALPAMTTVGAVSSDVLLQRARDALTVSVAAAAISAMALWADSSDSRSNLAREGFGAWPGTLHDEA